MNDVVSDVKQERLRFLGLKVEEAWQELTIAVLSAVLQERKNQVARYGFNEDLEDGTGATEQWLMPAYNGTAENVESLFRFDYEMMERQDGKPTWLRLVREEVAEAFKEADPARLEEELLQVAALCVSWVERLRSR